MDKQREKNKIIIIITRLNEAVDRPINRSFSTCFYLGGTSTQL